MRKRSSVEKAEWTEKREESYMKECFKMAFNNKDKLEVENQTVYILREKERITILKPVKDKSFWFETWTALKSYYNV